MKRDRTFLSVLFAAMVSVLMISGCIGQNGRSPAKPHDPGTVAEISEGQSFISFDTAVHDFGTIIEGERVMCYFTYRNTGESELMLKRVVATCGCTSPDWSREALHPGESEVLGVMFDASGRSGVQRKQITVYSNGEPEKVSLTIKANVRKN